MRGTQLFEASIDGHITTKSNRKNTDWNDRLETEFSNLSSFPPTRRIAIDANEARAAKTLMCPTRPSKIGIKMDPRKNPT